VLSGATLMAPGLTSAGGRLPTGNAEETGKYGETGAEGDEAGFYGGRELDQGEPVVICAEGKREACAVGLLSMGTKEVKEKGKGPVVEDAHYLGDGLWKLALSD
jgi:malignant T-cell-amplified sequence